MFWKTGPRTRSFSSPRAARCWWPSARRTRTRSRPRSSTGWTASPSRATLRAVVGEHRRCQRRDRRRRAPDGLRAGSCERLLERFVAALTGDQDAAVSDRPRDRAADPRMASELAIAVPHGALERERQLVTTTPSLDVDELIALDATERDRSRRSPVASATRERNDRDRRAATLELLPHSLASRQLAPPGTQPGRMRLGSLTTRRRVARVARQRLACRTAPRPPSAGHVQTRRRPATGAV